MKFVNWAKQPTTIGAFALVAGSAVYWFTGNSALTVMAVTVILGGVNDHTKQLLERIESLEDAVKAPTSTSTSTSTSASKL